jgi:actin, other eukaryote
MSKEFFVGDEYQQKRYIPKDFFYPMKYGIIHDFENMERIWYHTFYNELRVAPEEQPVLLTEDNGNSKENKRKTCEIMFETFGVQQLMLKNSSILQLTNEGKTSGIVLDLGDSFNQACSIIDGKVETAVKSYFGGRDVTSFLVDLLNNQEGQNNNFSTVSWREIVRDIKEKKCIINLGELNKDSGVSYELPNGNILNISDAMRSNAPELLFNPRLVEEIRYEYSVSQLIDQVFKKTNSKFHSTLTDSIILVGGGSMFPYISERINMDQEKLFQRKCVITASKDRKYSDWIGGSKYLSKGLFKEEEWMMAEEYKEYGSSIVDEKCPFVETNPPIVPFKTSELSKRLFKMSSGVTDLRFKYF